MNETTTALEARLASEAEALRGEVARLRACIAEVRRKCVNMRLDTTGTRFYADGVRDAGAAIDRVLDRHAPVKPDLAATQQVEMVRK